MHDDRLYSDANLVQFYDLENGWAADTAYCARLARDVESVLDLGCGTGLFLSGIDGPATRVGVDPAEAMLDVARTRPGGTRVEWIRGDARTLRLARRFGLVVLTGHAFQVFLTDDDQRAALATIAAHLASGGRFVFDSRNPADEDWRTWVPEESARTVDHPTLGAVEAWNDVRHDPATGIVTYQTHYRVIATGRHLSADSRIRFTPRDVLAARMAEAGLVADTWLGGWDGRPFTDDAPEIIPIGRRA